MQPFLRAASTIHQAAGKIKYTEEQLDRLDLGTLLKFTPKTILERSFTVRPVGRYYETGSMDGFRRTHYKYPTYYNQVRMYMSASPAGGGSGRRHTSYIRFYGPPDLKTPVWVWCDCEYFTYYLEVLLAKQGSSSIKRSNGEPPTEVYTRKPWVSGTPIPHLCKHLVRASEWGLSQKKDLAALKGEKEMAAEKEKGASTQASFVSFP